MPSAILIVWLPLLIFCRKLKGSKTSTKISECIPSFCTAYVVSKGKLSFVHSYT
uniref:Uncharacterized protein n=1 Tax=Aegilops tauschii subsp. strangulata TaxID=200361 RepID=A0A453EJJ1_AEGTS